MIYIQFNFGLLLQCVLGNCLECLLDVDGFFSGRLKVGDVAFRLAPCHSTLLGHLRIRNCQHTSHGKICGVYSPASYYPPHQSCSLGQQRGSSPGHVGSLESRTRLANCLGSRTTLSCSRRIRAHSNLRPDRMQHQVTGTALAQLCPIAVNVSMSASLVSNEKQLTCMVTRRSSTMTSFVKLHIVKHQAGHAATDATHKSAPMVALYWLLNRLFTYWFINDVLPTLF